jgi:hypothetical protein
MGNYILADGARAKCMARPSSPGLMAGNTKALTSMTESRGTAYLLGLMDVCTLANGTKVNNTETAHSHQQKEKRLKASGIKGVA